MGKRFLAIIAVLLTAITAPFTVYSKSADTLNSLKNAVEGVVAFKCDELNASSFDELLDKLSENAGTYSSDWYYIAFSQYGHNCNNQKSIEALKNKVDEFYSGSLADVKVTDMQRAAFALSACSVDITDVNGHNLLADSTYNRAKAKPLNSQGVNSAAYALLLLDSKSYSVPENAETTRDEMIAMILKSELEDGGFALFGKAPDIDVTSIAMQALAPYKSRSDVSSALDRCVDILSKRQDSTGGYKSFSNEISCESTAQAILCLTALGINPISDSRFIKKGNSLLDGLMVFNLDSGAFSHFKGSKPDNMATYQALCALVSTYRFINGCKSFYDFTEKPERVEVKQKANNSSVSSSNNSSKKENKSNNSKTNSSPTDRPTDKVEFLTKPSNTKTRSKAKAEENTTSTVEETIAENVNNSKNENKNNSKMENKPTPPYISCALLTLLYLAVLLIKRRKL